MSAAPTPAAAFAAAQDAMARGDWDAFFACLDAGDLRRICASSFGLLRGEGAEVFAAVCADHDIPAEDLSHVRGLADRIEASAAESLRTWPGLDGTPAEREAALAQSLAHRDLVREHEAAVDACLRHAGDLPALAAAIERLRRDAYGGGAVSKALFTGETLHDVRADVAKATAVRRSASGHEEPVRFVRRRGEWRIRLLPSCGEGVAGP